MARLESSAVQSHLRALLAEGTHAGLTDAQLLEQFLARSGETAELAFATLVARHGPMVLGVCRRILNDPHDAADAFQATFLVLVKRAPALRIEGSLGRWLHGVGRRVALQARRAAARHRARDVRSIELFSAPERDSDRCELRAILDEEIARLPEKYRDAVVLCDLQGLAQPAAARLLGCPCGTIASRLARGRARLRNRLTRRGLAPGMQVLPALLRPIPVPPVLSGTLVRAAAETGAGTPLADAVSAPVRALLIGFRRGMTIRQITLVATPLTLIFIAAAAELAGRAGARVPDGSIEQVMPAPPANPRAANVLVLPGTTQFDPNTLTKVSTGFDAVVEKVHVGLGAWVNKGDPLLELSSTELAVAKNELQTSYIQWRVDTLKLKNIKLRLKSHAARNELRLRESGESRSRLAFMTAREKLVVRGVSAAEIDSVIEKAPGLLTPKPDTELSAKARLTRLAPIGGVVIQLSVAFGTYYDSNDTLLTIANVDHLWVWASLPADLRARVEAGQDCEVEFPNSDLKTLAGTIEYIAEQTSPDTPSKFQIRLTIPNPERRLKADMLVRVKVLPVAPAARP
jgi:RNA polymerase sigma factor (sigma-70 family)